jgi:Predicted phosphotransferase related to Ser/Thr protein kinases
MSSRLEQLHEWIRETLEIESYTLKPASEDASFRRYFRICYDGQSRIVMDAPPGREDCAPYIDIAGRLQAAGIHAPAILQKDMRYGFLLLEDLGTSMYLEHLSNHNADQLYADALDALAAMQKNTETSGLPPYDESLLMKEMSLFLDWLLGRHLHLSLTLPEQGALQQVFDLLTGNALQQPRVFVHRDYHSRNLMVCPRHNPGVLDFQDAVFGPITYDIVSLLKDCYIKWPRQRIYDWALGFYRRINQDDLDEAGFLRWFDLMGVQRQLKASGIFARLFHRDGKPGYLKDIPRTLSYILDLGGAYSELDFLIKLIGKRVMPALEEANRTCAP